MVTSLNGRPNADLSINSAATMVTAGVFMVARLSPMYQLSTALSVVLIVGATGALFLGLLAFVGVILEVVLTQPCLSWVTMAIMVRLLFLWVFFTY